MNKQPIQTAQTQIVELTQDDLVPVSKVETLILEGWELSNVTFDRATGITRAIYTRNT